MRCRGHGIVGKWRRYGGGELVAGKWRGGGEESKKVGRKDLNGGVLYFFLGRVKVFGLDRGEWSGLVLGLDLDLG